MTKMPELSDEETRESIAKLSHLVWQQWMAYMLTNLDEQHIDRWKRQANTIYENLSEAEKESDRVVADRYIKAIAQAQRELLGGYVELPSEGELSEWLTRCYGKDEVAWGFLHESHTDKVARGLHRWLKERKGGG